MPFDGVTLKEMEIQERRNALLAELRKPQPDWDFRLSSYCAIGIACCLEGRISMGATELATKLGIPHHWDVFTSPSVYGVSHRDKVTQLMVADRLEDLFRRANKSQ